MAARTQFKITADAYRTLPETGPPYQLIDGDLIRRSPAPSVRHQLVVWQLGAKMLAFVAEHGLGTVVGAPIDVFLSEHDVVQPDLLFVSNERADRIAAEGLHGAPDLVVEVLSPSTRRLDLGAKKALYARHGVLEYWTVDLERGEVSVYRLQEHPGLPVRTLSAGTLTSALLPGLEVSVEELLR